LFALYCCSILLAFLFVCLFVCLFYIVVPFFLAFLFVYVLLQCCSSLSVCLSFNGVPLY
jgi:hypothetical protein